MSTSLFFYTSTTLTLPHTMQKIMWHIKGCRDTILKQDISCKIEHVIRWQVASEAHEYQNGGVSSFLIGRNGVASRFSLAARWGGKVLWHPPSSCWKQNCVIVHWKGRKEGWERETNLVRLKMAPESETVWASNWPGGERSSHRERELCACGASKKREWLGYIII